ncbi:MAG: 2-dehydropantoate 2-reductase [Deltaproteobacteria bacterium]|nr:2-dehydropantoate 2-reductase [Deltaproteobacteria bacterium]
MSVEKCEFKPNVLVVGAGAVGSLYGGKLAQVGSRVSVLCRSDYEAVKAGGIAIISHWGDFHFSPDRVVRDLGEWAEPPDYILVTLKVLPEIDVADIIANAVGPETAIVLLQNGVEIEPAVARAYPDNEIISGLAFVCVTRIAPGRVEHSDYGRLVLGRFPSGRSAKAERLRTLFEKAGVPCEVTEDVVAARWRKLLWNAPFNSLSVLGGNADTQKIMQVEEAVHLARVIMHEVRLIAEADGHPFEPNAIERNLAETRVMKPYRTSMLVDFVSRRPMEIEAILGNAIRAAERYAIDTPYLKTVYALLKLIESENR